MRARIVVDWDDTLVRGYWPAQGPWLPGAVEALRELNRHGDVVIFSCRVSPYKFPSQRTPAEDIERDPVEVAMTIGKMRRMLTDAGLGHIEIWQRPYKPSATLYIDNKGLRFTGDWDETLDDAYEAMSLPLRFKQPERTVADDERERIMLPAQDLTEHMRATFGAPERHPNSQRFHDLLQEAGELHDKKQLDYGRGDDPFSNVRGSEEWGIEGWIGAMVRATDKVRRLQTFARKGELANEAVVDAFMDLAVYALIARVLYEEES